LELKQNTGKGAAEEKILCVSADTMYRV